MRGRHQSATERVSAPGKSERGDKDPESRDTTETISRGHKDEAHIIRSTTRLIGDLPNR
jgi:hypothetical protein